MPTQIRIIQAKEFLKVTTHGTLDVGESKRVLVQLAAIRPSSSSVSARLASLKSPSTPATPPSNSTKTSAPPSKSGNGQPLRFSASNAG
jgi:hypothetical protein